MTNKTVLISGAGIAGPTLAYWLLQYGYSPTVCECASALRTGGYVVDFWGRGYDIAERMGLIPELNRIGYHVGEVRFVDAHGGRVGGIENAAIENMLGGRFLSLRRSDLSRQIFDKIEDACELIFNDSVVELHEEENGVRAVFARGGERVFSLAIGADGLHSRLRELAFGPQERFEAYLGHMAAAFEIPAYRPRDENIYVAYAAPGRQVARFSMRDDRTLVLFVFAADRSLGVAVEDLPRQKELLHELFGKDGWECPQILAALDDCQEFYFDRVSQIRMNGWSKGRVALVGDAAFCVSLIGGQGSALAMTGAYILAGEIARAEGRPEIAFSRYEGRLRAYIEGKQKGAERFARSFVPGSRLGLFVRNQVTKFLTIPMVARLAFGRVLVEQLTLPDYSDL